MHGARRVIIFCLLTAVLPTILLIIPLYLRHSVFADVVYPVAESDVLEIGDGISTVFCQDHTLKMNSSFNAYQLDNRPEISSAKKHIRLKKSMRLPDDTLEYWGFFLPRGSVVLLSVCSKFAKGKALVIKGEKVLETCGMLNHSKTKEPLSNNFKGAGQVRVTFETNAQEILSSDADKLLTPLKEDHVRKRRSTEDLNDASEVEDSEGMKVFKRVRDIARSYLSHKSSTNLQTFEEKLLGHKLRHAKASGHRRKLNLSNHEIDNRIESDNEVRKRRNVPLRTPHNLDAKVAHGGNAWNRTEKLISDGSSESSFESGLLDCYKGNVLTNTEMLSSLHCTNVSFLFSPGAEKMTVSHNVTDDGYYYYIFYSDNDYVENDIHAVFDIFKPTYQYANVSQKCFNQTECTFPVRFMSEETVVVEVPTRDGIEHEGDDITYLISTCQPRMSVYIIFPILVLFLILGCAFL